MSPNVQPGWPTTLFLRRVPFPLTGFVELAISAEEVGPSPAFYAAAPPLLPATGPLRCRW